MKYKFVDGKRVATLKKIDCPICKKDFKPKTSKNKYCSRNCYYIMKKKRGDRVHWTDEMRKKMSEKYKGVGNPAYGKPSKRKGIKRPNQSGSKHPNWNGGCGKQSNGYIYHYINGKEILEHRIIMEQHIGRKLKNDEIVHHINEIKDDNKIENLQIVTRAQHINIHRKKLNK